jgi:hypothetical protein
MEGHTHKLNAKCHKMHLTANLDGKFVINGMQSCLA